MSEPKPAMFSPESCMRCMGTGLVMIGRTISPCHRCDGSGRLRPTTNPETSSITRDDVCAGEGDEGGEIEGEPR